MLKLFALIIFCISSSCEHWPKYIFIGTCIHVVCIQVVRGVEGKFNGDDGREEGEV